MPTKMALPVDGVMCATGIPGKFAPVTRRKGFHVVAIRSLAETKGSSGFSPNGIAMFIFGTVLADGKNLARLITSFFRLSSVFGEMISCFFQSSAICGSIEILSR